MKRAQLVKALRSTAKYHRQCSKDMEGFFNSLKKAWPNEDWSDQDQLMKGFREASEHLTKKIKEVADLLEKDGLDD